LPILPIFSAAKLPIFIKIGQLLIE